MNHVFNYSVFFLICSLSSSNVDQEFSEVFLLFSFLHFQHLFFKLLEEVLPQVGQFVHLSLVRVAILFQLEKPFEKHKIIFLLLQSLFLPFLLLALALALTAKDVPR